MSNNHLIVSKRDTAWQFSYRGDVTGPFISQDAAVAEAIAAARATGLSEVEVIVQHPDTKTETVWRAGS